MTNSSPPPRRRSLFWTVWLLAGAALLVAYLVWKPDSQKPNGQPPDPVAAAQANARGVAHMERFTESDRAVAAFEEAIRLAPDWPVPKINLGIALLNTARKVTDPVLDRALGIFADVLKADPNNPYALYSSGMIHLYRNNLEAAHTFFARVAEIDPTDAHAVYHRGVTRPDEPNNPESKRDYETALKLNPHLNTARYRLAQHGHERDDDVTKALIDEWQRLKDADWESVALVEYTRMGRYAEVIGGSHVPSPAPGPFPVFAHARPAVPLPPGSDDGPRKVAADRFGAAVVLLDFDRDGRPDVFLPGARDVLLRNDGAGGFTDVTAAAGLDKHPGGFGGAAADFDNDGWSDLTVTGPAGVRLFRNADGKRFEDKTKDAAFDALTGTCLGAAWLDLDQDADLDLVVAHSGPGPGSDGRLVVFANVGVAPPAAPGAKAPPLTCKFQRVAGPDALLVKGPVVNVVAADLDGDRDVDLIVLVDGQPPVTVLNDRLMRFRRGDSLPVPAADWDGGLVFDANGDDQSDLLLVPAGKPPVVLVSKADGLGDKFGDRFAAAPAENTSLRTADRTDLDLDGRADVVGLDGAGRPVVLRGGEGKRLVPQPDPFGPDVGGLRGLAVGDLDGDGHPDAIAVGTNGLHVFRNLGTANRGVRLVLTGRRDPKSTPALRTNADGIGAKVIVQAGPVQTRAELTTQAVGLGQSRVPLHLGVGSATAADAVRVRWPDFVTQAELNQPTDGVVEIVELSRMQSSCPVLFTWDGRRFAYVADFLGGGAVGETGPDGSIRQPRPEESVKIEASQLVPRNGKYVVKVTEPMDEVMYLDHLRLAVIDHPKDVVAFPDERFATADPQPTQELLAFRGRSAPAKATDHRGRDVTAKLRHRDRDAVDGFAVRSWLGFAEEHWVELDFGEGLQKVFLPSPLAGEGDRKTSRLFLVLTGWTEYAFPESIYAAAQAGVPMLPPVLEQRQSDGSWKKLDDLGFPAGLMRVMTKEVTGRIDPAGGPIRIRTNLRIYWDQVFLAPLAAPDAMTVRELPVSRANLEYVGFAQEVTPGGKPPVEYDHDRREPVSVTPWKGRLTRFGDVTELLASTDDRHVIAGPGDEVTAEFDAALLPPVPAGWVRSFVLRTAGYCKDTAPTTASGGRVGPVPYRGMPAYPYDVEKMPPHVAEYDRKWNTRPANGGK